MLEKLIRELAQAPEKVDTLSLEQIQELLPEIWVSEVTTLPVLEKVLERFLIEGKEEDVIEGLRVMATSIFDYGLQQPGEKFEILRDYSEEEVVDMLQRVIARAEHEYTQRLAEGGDNGKPLIA